MVAFSFQLVIAMEQKLVFNEVLLAAYPIALISAPSWSEELCDVVWDIGPRAVSQLVDSILAGVAGAVGLLLVFLAKRDGTGMGDVRLMLAIGLWVGLR